MMPRCGRCGAEAYLFSVQDHGAAGCDGCGLIVYEDGDTRDTREESRP